MAIVEYQPKNAEPQQYRAGPNPHPAQGQECPRRQQSGHHHRHRQQMPNGNVPGGRVEVGRTLPLQGEGHGKQPPHRRVQAMERPQSRQAQPRPQRRQSRRVGYQRVQQYCRHRHTNPATRPPEPNPGTTAATGNRKCPMKRRRPASAPGGCGICRSPRRNPG